ncbi:MAG: succinylglutamate desuccinylase/aspartoacylase family protein [Crocinitomicaceae bacterium]|nr:succinylglutamate desuccinylase/aspartoacylase family protein [Crocinitomicaceae bacterium]MCF8433897.1 succinylglutamate desuccinylase/aspartoacylase family protein [Crocinitomicaceae bacterium]
MPAHQHHKKIVILGKEILPGKGAQLNLDVAKLHTTTPILVPVIIERAKVDGPTVLLMAGMHGDEINGVEIIRRVIRKGFNKPQIGTIICLPVFNIFGFLNLKRELPDGRDLNRSFPGSESGSLASQFAFHFMKEIAPHVDYVIDFHTGSAQRNNFPQIRCVLDNEESVELAKIFNPPYILNSSYISKTIRESISKLDKKMLLFEGGKTNSIEEFIVEEGLNGVKRFLSHMGMRTFKIDLSKDRTPVVLSESRWMRSPNSGMFQALVKNGARVNKGEVIGIVTDPYGKIERKVKANSEGYIICLNESPVVYKGDAIFHIGKEAAV